MEQVKREFEHRWQELGDFVREQRRLGEMSLRRLSELSGISNPYLSQIERGLRRPSADILQQLARAFEISAETLFVRAGILVPHEAPTDLVDAIRRDPDLGEAQKRTLIHIYESFRAEAAGSSRPPEPSTTERQVEHAGDTIEPVLLPVASAARSVTDEPRRPGSKRPRAAGARDGAARPRQTNRPDLPNGESDGDGEG